MDLLLN